MNPLWNVLVESSLELAILIAAASLTVFLLRGASARARHAVWATVLIPVAALVALAAANPFGLPSLSLPVFAAPDVVAQQSVVPTATRLAADENVALVDLGHGRIEQRPAAIELPPAFGSATVNLENTESAASSSTLTALDLVVGTWIAVVGLLLASLALSLSRVRGIVRRAQPVLYGPLARALERGATKHGVRAVKLVTSAEVGTPFAFGIRQPLIVLPAEATSWSDERTEVVLAHELAHIARRDWSVRILAQLFSSVLWFHPLVWLAYRGVVREQERACDDAVLESGVKASDYAEHLLALTRERARSREPMAALAMAGRSSMETRLMNILTKTPHDEGLESPKRSRLAGWSVAAVLCALTLGALFVQPWANAGVDPDHEPVAPAAPLATESPAPVLPLAPSVAPAPAMAPAPSVAPAPIADAAPLPRPSLAATAPTAPSPVQAPRPSHSPRPVLAPRADTLSTSPTFRTAPSALHDRLHGAVAGVASLLPFAQQSSGAVLPIDDLETRQRLDQLRAELAQLQDMMRAEELRARSVEERMRPVEREIRAAEERLRATDFAEAAAEFESRHEDFELKQLEMMESQIVLQRLELERRQAEQAGTLSDEKRDEIALKMKEAERRLRERKSAFDREHARLSQLEPKMEQAQVQSQRAMELAQRQMHDVHREMERVHERVAEFHAQHEDVVRRMHEVLIDAITPTVANALPELSGVEAREVAQQVISDLSIHLEDDGTIELEDSPRRMRRALADSGLSDEQVKRVVDALGGAQIR